jgi:hypothetical protein
VKDTSIDAEFHGLSISPFVLSGKRAVTMKKIKKGSILPKTDGQVSENLFLPTQFRLPWVWV